MHYLAARTCVNSRTRSDPDSPDYGKHWTSEQIIDHFKPSDDTVDAVRQWLVDSGIADSRITHTDNKGWFALTVTGDEANKLLKTQFHEFEDSHTGKVTPGCDEYSLPEHIREHVDYVTPGIKLFSSSRASRTTVERRSILHGGPGGTSFPILFAPAPFFPAPDDLSTCDVTITPACIRALYNIPKPTLPPNPSNALGIYESELEFYTQTDLDLFFKNLSSNIPPGTHPDNVSIDGGQAETSNISMAGGEADLDLQLAYPIIYPQKITVYDEDDLNYQANPNDTYTGGFNTFLDALDGSYCTYSAYGETGDSSIDPTYPDPAPGGYKGQLQCGTVKPTNVISISYGGQEVDVPIGYQKRQCNEYMKLGMQGVSILFASGDSGIGNYPAPYGGDGPTGCIGKDYTVFNPTWPNSCPWLTNVGATKVYQGKSVFQPESAVFDPAGHPYAVNYSSGGGFSNIFGVPDYQKSAVSTYFSQHNPPYKSYSGLAQGLGDVEPEVERLSANGGVYNRIGRGIPDVAANGDNIGIYVGGKYQQSGGTSAATPIFASVVNRIIEERLRVGKKPLGFLNPTLYKAPFILNDITNGSNPDCGYAGFSAVPGWDPVSGLGTPNFPKMLAYYLSLP